MSTLGDGMNETQVVNEQVPNKEEAGSKPVLGTDSQREELLKAVAACWAAVGVETVELIVGEELLCLEFHLDPSRTYSVAPSLWLIGEDMKDAEAAFAMLDELERRDLAGLGPEVLVELCGSGKEWVCRRVICPHSDTSHVSQEGRGPTRAWAVARAFVAALGTEEVKP